MIPRASAILCTTFETKTEPSSVITTVGRYACLVITLMKTFAVLMAVGLDTWYAIAYLENTSTV